MARRPVSGWPQPVSAHRFERGHVWTILASAPITLRFGTVDAGSVGIVADQTGVAGAVAAPAFIERDLLERAERMGGAEQRRSARDRRAVDREAVAKLSQPSRIRVASASSVSALPVSSRASTATASTWG